MKVFAILGGLGSQMCKYALYIAVKKKTKHRCLIDTTYFMQKNSWNGYELKKIFNIDAEDMADIADPETIERIKTNKEDYVTAMLRYIDRKEGPVYYYFLGHKTKFRDNQLCRTERLIQHKALMFGLGHGLKCEYREQDLRGDFSAYYDEYPINSDEFYVSCKNEICKAFTFPAFNDDRDLKIANDMKNESSVALHVRRTDHMGDNGKLYKRQYYQKAVKMIKEKEVEEPTFYIFSEDIAWCKKNLHELGVENKEKAIFVDWHNGENSYRDMQLMTYCKHNVLAISSFSWWGYYLSKREDKIVCAPEGFWKEVDYHF